MELRLPALDGKKHKKPWPPRTLRQQDQSFVHHFLRAQCLYVTMSGVDVAGGRSLILNPTARKSSPPSEFLNNKKNFGEEETSLEEQPIEVSL